MDEGSQGAGAPSADFKALQTQAEAAQLGVDAATIEAERGASLSFNLLQGAMLAQRLLERVESLADMIDQGACAAEIERAGGSVFTIAEAIVRAERLAAAMTPSGVEGSVLGKELGPGG